MCKASLVKILYTNWKGNTKYRRISPINIAFDSNQWHQEPQWLLKAVDCDKGEIREFAIKDIKEWIPL